MAIQTFKHKSLQRLYEDDDARGVGSAYVERLKIIMTALDSAATPDDLNSVPSLRLHPLKGDRKGYWSIKVSGNWRVTFRMEGKDICDVDFEDYH